MKYSLIITHSFTHDDLCSKKYVVIPADVLQLTCEHKNKVKEKHQQSYSILHIFLSNAMNIWSAYKAL